MLAGAPPLHPMDVVYLVGPQFDNEELRYSLRSLKNLQHGKVVIAGGKPKWAKPDVMIEVTRQRSGGPFQHTTDSLRAAARHPEVSEEFVVMNDDFFITKPVEELPVWHRGLMQPNRVRMFYGFLGDAPLSYELHTPMTLAKTRVVEMFDLPVKPYAATMWKRSLYGNYFDIGGEQREDVKVRTVRETWTDTGFLSTNDLTFAHADVGCYLREMFREPCQYEEDSPS